MSNQIVAVTTPIEEKTPETLEELTGGDQKRVIINIRRGAGNIMTINIAQLKIDALSLLRTELYGSAIAICGKLEVLRNNGIYSNDQRAFRMIKARRATLNSIAQLENVMRSVKLLTKERNRAIDAERKKQRAKKRRQRAATRVSETDYFQHLKKFRLVTQNWFNQKTFTDIDEEAARLLKEELDEERRRQRYG